MESASQSDRGFEEAQAKGNHVGLLKTALELVASCYVRMWQLHGYTLGLSTQQRHNLILVRCRITSCIPHSSCIQPQLTLSWNPVHMTSIKHQGLHQAVKELANVDLNG